MREVIQELPVLGAPDDVERDRFLRLLLRHLAGALEDVVGVREAEGFVSLVGRRMGDDVSLTYSDRIHADSTAEELGEVLCEFKKRIGGGFEVERIENGEIVFTNTACPFGSLVKDRQSLCAMTSNVFGVVASNVAGRAEVEIEEAIARGDAGCRVVVRLGPDAGTGVGRLFYRT